MENWLEYFGKCLVDFLDVLVPQFGIPRADSGKGGLALNHLDGLGRVLSVLLDIFDWRFEARPACCRSSIEAPSLSPA